MASVGAGAVVGGLMLSAAGDLPRKGLLAVTCAAGFGGVLTAFAVVRSVGGMALLLFALGVLQTTCVASLNTAIQLAVRESMRGRVMSLWTMILFGVSTVGGLVLGMIGDRIGVPQVISLGGCVIIFAAAGVLLRAPELVGTLARTIEA
jgi:hypothetical protein